jgi:glyoxylase-like metal-dependent hydrolase (beta-lactamase superfamily II)
MVYTGQVKPGGPSDVRRLDRVVIRKASVSEMDNNCYLLTCRVTGQQLLVDAADGAPRLHRLIDEEAGREAGVEHAETAGRLDAIVTTHQHWDHHRALAELVQTTGARTLAGRQDADALPVSPGELLDHGDVVTFGDVELTVVHLRGHTPGSVALLYQDPGGDPHLFTGDSLFPGGPGRTTSATDFDSLLTDLQMRVFDVLPDRTWVYPGHGDDTTLGVERPSLPQWRDRGW